MVVNVASDIALITPDSQTGLTNADGVATFRVEDNGTIGAGTITVTVNDAPAGVFNDRGQVHHYRNLFVADAAIIPTALTVNPSLTIGALAERIAHLMSHADELPAAD